MKMKKNLLLLVLSSIFLTIIVAAQTQNDDAPIKVDTLLLTTTLVVRDEKGKYVTGLKKENFSIFEDREKQDIAFFYGEESPMNVAILLDTSASTKDVLGKIQKAARDFVKVFRPEDRGLIVSFNNRTQFLSNLTSDKKQLSKAIGNAQIIENAGSDMNAAVLEIIKNHFSGLKGRKAIIVLTDGMVIKRNISTQQTLDALLDADTVFYPIVFKSKFYSSAWARPKKPLPIEMLEFLAHGTAGSFYEKDATDLKEAFQSIAEELKKQYLIGFYPQDTSEKAQNDVEIKVDRKNWTVETKKKWRF